MIHQSKTMMMKKRDEEEGGDEERDDNDEGPAYLAYLMVHAFSTDKSVPFLRRNSM